MLSECGASNWAENLSVEKNDVALSESFLSAYLLNSEDALSLFLNQSMSKALSLLVPSEINTSFISPLVIMVNI